jgi:hypothetical protein
MSQAKRNLCRHGPPIHQREALLKVHGGTAFVSKSYDEQTYLIALVQAGARFLFARRGF